MSQINLSNELIQHLSQVLEQLSQTLPPVQKPIDFSAIAFKWKNGTLTPIYHPKAFELESLKGIDIQKQKIVQNTKQFIHGLPANDVLLTGARGTGKSSIVRALLTSYHHLGLRLIEIERDELVNLPLIKNLIVDRPEKFIIYCDDLAFNAEDEHYRSLKSVIDGALESGHQNFLVYATSNRRHLLPEFMSENVPTQKVDVPQYHELHPQEAVEEKISLSDRFGLWLSFYPMPQDVYLDIVKYYLQQKSIEMSEDVRLEAIRWTQMRGQRSGRAAYQFSKHWIGSKQLLEITNKLNK